MKPDVIDGVNALCAEIRKLKAQGKLCQCGKVAVVSGRCRGCDEDHFYGRHIPGARTTGD